jgi:hypothetical protein
MRGKASVFSTKSVGKYHHGPYLLAFFTMQNSMNAIDELGHRIQARHE